MVREQLMQNLSSDTLFNLYCTGKREEDKRLVIDIEFTCKKHIGKKSGNGHNGAMIKKIGESARKRLQMFKKRIMLKTWVKVNPQLSESCYIDQYLDT